MDRPKLYGVVMTVLCVVVAACSAGQPQQEPAATVEEVPPPQRPMTVKNSYHPELLPFHKGEPFVVDPNTGSIDFNTKPPPSPQRSDEYYDYDTKLEEVPYDYKGDPIDRKDVVEPSFPRPNDIKPNNNKVKQTDIYKFLNLPKNYNISDKFPLISSSYANTKVQGSGPSSLSNHKMPAAQTSSPTPSSWYNTVRTTAFVKPTATTPISTTSTTTTTTTTTTTATPPVQEYEDDYYDYFHSQEPAAAVSSENAAVTTTSTANPTTATTRRGPPSEKNTPAENSTIMTTVSTTTTPLYATSPAAAVSSTAASTTTAERLYTANPPPAVSNKTTVIVATTTTSRPEIDSKPDDGTSFADYDDTIKPAEKEHHQEYNNRFKPLPGNYQFDEKTYPLITNGKVPMTFTAHVSSGISLSQKEVAPPNMRPPTAVSEPTHSSSPIPVRPETAQDTNTPLQETTMYDNSKVAISNKPDATINPSADASSTYLKPKLPKPSETGQFETVYHRVKPDTYAAQRNPPSAAVPNRPVNSPIQSHSYQPEQPPTTKTSQANIIHRKPVNTAELQMSQARPLQPYPVQSELLYTKTKPQQYTPPPTKQPDTSKFKPPKHVINHFIKTQPNEDNKSYALQTSFSIGMDGERTETRPAQGIGQVLMVEDTSSESTVIDQTTTPIMKPKPSTTSIPLVPPPRHVQKPPQSYPRPQWENVPKPPPYYPPAKRDNVQPAQRPNLPNILPQFRPNAKVDAPPTVPQSHSATIERVQIPMDHLRPPPLPKPQFLKLERNDENIDEEILDIPEKETRILQRTGPQPAKVTTLQMIQHGGAPTKTRDEIKENPVHIVYAANSPPKPSEKLVDDSVILDVKDRSDVPILKTKTNVYKPIKTDFPYQIVKPEENQNASSLEYKAYSPTKSDTIRPNNDQELIANLQDYNPMVTRDPAPNMAIPQKPIAVTLKTSEDNHKTSIDEGRKPLLQNFQIPFQPSLKLPENSNGWSVVRKSQTDNASERIDETNDTAASTEKFDPDNFKPQLVGGFMPISSPLEEVKEKKTIEQPERAKKSIKD